MRNIVILGAGFGGLRVALKLEKFFGTRTANGLQDDWSIILIDKNSYHTYTSSLYEVASAYGASGARNFEELLGSAVCFPIRSIIENKNIVYTHGEVESIDFYKKTVQMKSGDAIPFEYLVLALGSETSYFDVEGAEKCCYGLKTAADALRIRDRIAKQFLSAAKRGKVEISMVGAGFSGVETIAEIAVYAKRLAKAHKVKPSNVKISLFEATKSILGQAKSKQRIIAERRLKKLGVEIHTGVRTSEITPSCLVLEDGCKCRAGVILWGGGVKGPKFLEQFADTLALSNRGQVMVSPYLQVQSNISGKSHAFQKIFAIGDNANFVEEETGIPAPATAFIAEQQADTVARNIEATIVGRPLAKYRPSIPGYVLACGGKYAIVSLYGFTFAGFFGWAVKKMIDLRYFSSILPLPATIGLWLQELRLFTKND